MKRGIVLFAHGSRDPLWAKPIESIAKATAAHCPADTAVRCAYLELMQPDLLTVTSELATLGVQAISITPLFLGVGKHAREDLPRLIDQLTKAYPAVRFELQPPIGEHPLLIQTITKILLDA
jgi:sirohydrochlorin cobaltochelatase